MATMMLDDVLRAFRESGVTVVLVQTVPVTLEAAVLYKAEGTEKSVSEKSESSPAPALEAASTPPVKGKRRKKVTEPAPESAPSVSEPTVGPVGVDLSDFTVASLEQMGLPAKAFQLLLTALPGADDLQEILTALQDGKLDEKPKLKLAVQTAIDKLLSSLKMSDGDLSDGDSGDDGDLSDGDLSDDSSPVRPAGEGLPESEWDSYEITRSVFSKEEMPDKVFGIIAKTYKSVRKLREAVGQNRLVEQTGLTLKSAEKVKALTLDLDGFSPIEE